MKSVKAFDKKKKMIDLMAVKIVKLTLSSFLLSRKFQEGVILAFRLLPFLLTSALSRIPNTATCRRRLVALSHDPWRLLSLGVVHFLPPGYQLEENWAWPAAAVALPQKGPQ